MESGKKHVATAKRKPSHQQTVKKRQMPWTLEARTLMVSVRGDSRSVGNWLRAAVVLTLITCDMLGRIWTTFGVINNTLPADSIGT